MSDDANLTPEQEANLRRLLAEARHEDPMPEDVVSRLDRVLAKLAAGDADLDPEVVVALASRRRRVASTLLVAAAAVVAIGVGLGQVIPIGDSSDADQAGAADTSALRAESGDAPEAPADGLRAYSAAKAAPTPRGRVTQVRSLHFTTDVGRVGLRYGLDRSASADMSEVYGAEVNAPSPTSPQGSYDSAGSAESDDEDTNLTSAAKSAYVCAPAVWGPGRKVAVLYDGEPAVLVFRRPTGDSRVVDLLQCGTGDILRSVTLPR